MVIYDQDVFYLMICVRIETLVLLHLNQVS